MSQTKSCIELMGCDYIIAWGAAIYHRWVRFKKNVSLLRDRLQLFIDEMFAGTFP